MTTLKIAGGEGTYDLRPTKIVAVGLNYAEHVEESGSFDERLRTRPAEPVLFAKTPNTLIGTDTEIVIPRILHDYDFDEPRTDLEGELAIVVGERARNVSADDALDFVFGYTCFNDVSQRNIQMSDVSGWFRGKSFDTFGPIGPVLVLGDDLPDPQELMLSSRINGTTVQTANTSEMLFSIRELVAYISRNVTLEVGDIIATGTPSGVSPIAPGDVVEIEIEGIGILRNRVVQEARS